MEYLAHYGTKGMKWGVRRYENADGTLTPAGKRRYDKSVRKQERLEAKAAKYRSKSSFNKTKADYWGMRADKVKSRFFQTDISIARQKRLDKRRAKYSVKAYKYDKKAQRATKRAEKWAKRHADLEKAASKTVMTPEKRAKIQKHIERNS